MQMDVDVLIWMTVGIALLSSEAFTGTFHLLFFGLAALITAVFASLGLRSTALQMMIFAIFSVVSVILIRNRILNRSQGYDGDTDSRVILTADAPPDTEVTIQYQGVPWSAVNISSTNLIAGERARIVRTEGIKLMIEPEPLNSPAKA